MSRLYSFDNLSKTLFLLLSPLRPCISNQLHFRLLTLILSFELQATTSILTSLPQIKTRSRYPILHILALHPSWLSKPTKQDLPVFRGHWETRDSGDTQLVTVIIARCIEVWALKTMLSRLLFNLWGYKDKILKVRLITEKWASHTLELAVTFGTCKVLKSNASAFSLRHCRFICLALL